MPSFIRGIDHIQIAAPMGAHDAARAFYGALLGLEEIVIPPILQDRACCWFQCGTLQVHIGTQEGFQSARKAHPAFLTHALDELHPAFLMHALDELRKHLLSNGVETIEDGDHPDYRRFFMADPWGNRLEFLQRR